MTTRTTAQVQHAAATPNRGPCGHQGPIMTIDWRRGDPATFVEWISVVQAARILANRLLSFSIHM